MLWFLIHALLFVIPWVQDSDYALGSSLASTKKVLGSPKPKTQSPIIPIRDSQDTLANLVALKV